MKRDSISVRRRHLMIAGLAGAVTPVTLFAGQRDALFAEVAATPGGSHDLVVSGRIVGADGKPLFNATVEAWHAGAREQRASATTDGDGRFFATIASAGYSSRPRPLILYRVIHKGHDTQVKHLQFAREAGVSRDQVAHLQRDDTGAWRATFALTLA